jgi:PAS domain S-box-containing protein
MKEYWRQGSVIGFGLTLAVLIGGSVLGHVNVQRLAENERMVAHTHEVIGELESLLSTLTDAETGQRGYLLAEDEKYLQPYEDALRRVDASLAHLKDLTSDNPRQQTRLAALDGKIAARLDELKRTIALMKEGDRPAALKIVRSDIGKTTMDDLRERVAAMRQTEQGLLRQRAAESKSSSRTATVSIFLPALLGTVLVCLVFYLSQRNLLIRQRAAEVAAEERERLRTTLASIGDAVISTDALGRITNMNAVAESLTGWKMEEAAGQQLDSVFRIINEKTRAPVRDPATRAMKEGIIVGLANHTVLIAKGGTELPIDDSAAPIRCAKGEIVGCVLVFRDVTERRKAETAARYLASIVESSDDAIISKDINGVITSWNRGAERLFGYTAAEAIGRPIGIIAPLDRAGEMPALLARIRQGERVDHFDTVRRAKDGRLVPISLTVSPIRDADGEIAGASKIARDISERIQAEESLRQADRRKDEFLATLAHELRNPLAPIRNAVELMRRVKGDPVLMETARSMLERQVGQMVRLVDDLLDISRITRGKLQLRKEPVELAAVVASAVEVARPLIDSQSHELTITLPSEPIRLDADPVRLAQAFANLLNNAAKYTDKGGHIWLTAERQGSEAVVSVRDTGIGIAAQHLPRLFQMFSQIEPALERSQGGLGIGLSLVKGLIELHGGKVEAHSAGPGKGSEFTVRMPAAESRAPLLSEPAHVQKAPLGPGRRILVVDDNRDAAESLVMMLRMGGHETATAYDGLEAIQAAAAFRPHIVLLDIGLPKMNGYEAARHIRKQPWGNGMVLIALTGWGQEEDKRRALEAGFDQHLTKPVAAVALEELLTIIDQVPQC